MDFWGFVLGAVFAAAVFVVWLGLAKKKIVDK